MMEEYKDGSYGEIEELKEKLTKLGSMSYEELDPIKRLHIGTYDELLEMKGFKSKGNMELRNFLEKKNK